MNGKTVHPYCLNCHQNVKTIENWRCSTCGYQPECTDDVYIFAPHLSGTHDNYNPDWYAELVQLETHNFWFKARNQLIQWLAKTYSPNKGLYLEVGCGSGFVLQMLCKTFSNWKTLATEAQLEGIKFARERVDSDTDFFQMDACAIPFKNTFDVIGAYDVIEHISDDTTALEQIYAALKPGGAAIITVPQHMFLWSAYDKLGGHYRHYQPGQMETLLTNNGFNVIFSSSFNSLLLPLMIISRWLKNKQVEQNVDLLDELRLPPWLNGVLSLILCIEVSLIKYGVRFHAGGSRVILAKKPADLPPSHSME